MKTRVSMNKNELNSWILKGLILRVSMGVDEGVDNPSILTTCDSCKNQRGCRWCRYFYIFILKGYRRGCF